MRVSSKRSVQIPRDWSNRMLVPYFMCRGQEHGLPCIQVIPQAILHGRPKEIEGLDWTTWEKKIMTKELVSEKYHLIRLDPRSRLTLPRKWCAETGIGFPGDVMIAGRGTSFDFWNCKNFDLLLYHEVSMADDETTLHDP